MHETRLGRRQVMAAAAAGAVGIAGSCWAHTAGAAQQQRSPGL